MFAFLSKKLALSHDTLVYSLAWHQINDGLAVGGGQGLLRIIKLDDSHNPNQSKAEKGSDLLKNISLMGDHKAEITILNWNERYKKLLSCDAKGLMVIWTPSGDSWAAEMVNDSGKKLISDVKWSSDGSKLCILIDDGQVIVGSVDGEKLWAKNRRARKCLPLGLRQIDTKLLSNKYGLADKNSLQKRAVGKKPVPFFVRLAII